jgi:hypothetical protein
MPTWNAPNGSIRFYVRDANNTIILRLKWSYQPTHSPMLGYFLGAPDYAPTITNNMSFPQGWSVFEIHFRYTQQALPDNFEMKRNGVLIWSYGGATKPTEAAASLGYVEFGRQDESFNILDDVAINDTTGGDDNSWCGDGHVIVVRPNGNGDSSDFVGSDGNSVDNYQGVWKAYPANLDSFVESETSGAIDLYNASNISLHSTDVIRRVSIWAAARKMAAENDLLQLGFKGGSTSIWSVGLPLELDLRGVVGPSYKVNPITGLAWTQSDINALQIGVKIP